MCGVPLALVRVLVWRTVCETLESVVVENCDLRTVCGALESVVVALEGFTRLLRLVAMIKRKESIIV